MCEQGANLKLIGVDYVDVSAGVTCTLNTRKRNIAAREYGRSWLGYRASPEVDTHLSPHCGGVKNESTMPDPLFLVEGQTKVT